MKLKFKVNTNSLLIKHKRLCKLQSQQVKIIILQERDFNLSLYFNLNGVMSLHACTEIK